MKLLERIVAKNVSDPKKHDYHFWRWVSSLFEKRDKLEDVLTTVFMYMQKKHKQWQFTDIFLNGDKVFIYTLTPGVWIGKGGCVIYELEYLLNHDINGKKVNSYDICVIEDNESCMYTQKYIAEVHRKMCEPYE